MEKQAMSGMLHGFLEAIYRFQRREEGLFGTSWQDIFLLKHLAASGPASVGDLARYLELPLFDASRVISRLEALNLVIKERMAANRRVVMAAITRTGQDLLEKVEDFHFRIISRNLGLLDQAELASLTGAVGKLSQLLELDRPPETAGMT